MTEYRKHKSGRQFSRIEGDQVTRVVNLLWKTDVMQCNSSMVAEYVRTDEFNSPCTEQEFKEAFNEALSRIQNMTI
jgi:hypothetical protein